MKHILRALSTLAIAAALSALFALRQARPALAHTRIVVGPYVLVIGWANEPVIVGERNAITLAITEDGTPVEGAEGTLDFALEYAGRTYRGNLAPDVKPGSYRAEVFPTVRGQYEVHLSGAIGDLPVDVRARPEEVLAGEVIQFPEPQPDARELGQTVAELEGRVGTAYALAIGGVIVGVAGLGLAAFSLLRRR